MGLACHCANASSFLPRDLGVLVEFAEPWNQERTRDSRAISFKTRAAARADARAMEPSPYVHGYSQRETERLADQAAILRPLLHDGVVFPPGNHVLEPGCGTGQQTAALLAASPGIRITALDVDAAQLARARAAMPAGAAVEFVAADLLDAPLAPHGFDHASCASCSSTSSIRRRRCACCAGS